MALLDGHTLDDMKSHPPYSVLLSARSVAAIHSKYNSDRMRFGLPPDTRDTSAESTESTDPISDPSYEASTSAASTSASDDFSSQAISDPDPSYEVSSSAADFSSHSFCAETTTASSSGSVADDMEIDHLVQLKVCPLRVVSPNGFENSSDGFEASSPHSNNVQGEQDPNLEASFEAVEREPELDSGLQREVEGDEHHGIALEAPSASFEAVEREPELDSGLHSEAVEVDGQHDFGIGLEAPSASFEAVEREPELDSGLQKEHDYSEAVEVDGQHDFGISLEAPSASFEAVEREPELDSGLQKKHDYSEAVEVDGQHDFGIGLEAPSASFEAVEREPELDSGDIGVNLETSGDFDDGVGDSAAKAKAIRGDFRSNLVDILSETYVKTMVQFDKAFSELKKLPK